MSARYETRRDAAGNLVVGVPATAGREHAPTVVLQGHLDIVCERDPGSPFDPREGRIRVVRDGEWLRADGTTLGADNGVAIAAMLALVEDDAPHGPLELLMTVEEEVGMAGAAKLAPELISGGLLLNLDSEEDATLTVGCAGGVDSVVRLDAPRAPAGADDVALRVTVGGGRGGHSGGDIAAGRANAIKLLVARAGRRARDPDRVARRRREPQRDPARRGGDDRGRRGRGRSDPRLRSRPPAPTRRVRTTRPTPICGSRSTTRRKPKHGRPRRARGSSTSSRRSPPARSA